jgi:hypothetical protein
MNIKSIKHIYFENQQDSSWIDDPFDLKGAVTGVTRMTIKELDNFIQQLIANYGDYNFDRCDIDLSKIPSHDQDELLRLYIEYTGRELTECVNGNDFSIENDYTCALLSMLENNCPQTRLKFAQVTRNNILTYYSKSLQNLLDEGCHYYLCNMNNEMGYYSTQDTVTGETHWRKF